LEKDSNTLVSFKIHLSIVKNTLSYLLIPKVLRGQILAFAVLGHVAVIRRCDMIFGNFMVGRELEGLSVKLKNASFGPLL
jgi:hypothetical protein